MAHQGSGATGFSTSRRHVGRGYTRGGLAPASAGPPVAGYYAWWDAAQLAGADGSSVASWPDASANHRDLTAKLGTPTLYKTTSAKLINGHPTVYFNGDGHLATGSAVSLAVPFTVCAVARRDAGTTVTLWGCHDDNVGLALATSGNYNLKGVGAHIQAGSPDTAAHVTTGLLNGASSALRLDGTVLGSGGTGSTGITSVFVIGDEWDGAAFSGLTGPVGELLIYASALTTPQMQSIEAYLKAKWGTP